MPGVTEGFPTIEPLGFAIDAAQTLNVLDLLAFDFLLALGALESLVIEAPLVLEPLGLLTFGFLRSLGPLRALCALDLLTFRALGALGTLRSISLAPLLLRLRAFGGGLPVIFPVLGGRWRCQRKRGTAGNPDHLGHVSVSRNVHHNQR